MYNIGIIGNSSEYIKNKGFVQREIKRILDIIKFQYKESLVIGTNANIGVGHWAIKSCMELDIKYHLFLPGPIEEMSKYWFKDQEEDLSKYFSFSWANTICSPTYDKSCDNVLCENSNFVVVFWNRKKQGRTYECIKYCLQSNKMVIDGLANLKMLTYEDIK